MAAADPDVGRHGRDGGDDDDHQGIDADDDEHRLDERDREGDLRAAAAEPTREAAARDAR